ncbi:hypothetical protein ABW19_dt0206627 [Dactylella cylindrospora]|nr:hypothetical protein ABW19_dt0206627 [Dactylella cylindrospora]
MVESENNTWALLIGIDAYTPGNKRDIKLSNLKGCVRDVKALEDHLKNLNFHSIVTLTASEGLPVDHAEVAAKLPIFDNIFRELSYILDNARPGGLVYIHFSGHGVRRGARDIGSDDGGDYLNGAALALMDAMDGGAYLTGHNLGRFVKEMVEEKELRVNVVLDCCFSGRGLRSAEDEIDQIRGGECDLSGDILDSDRDADTEIDMALSSNPRNAEVRRSWLSNPTGCSILTACQFNQTAGERPFKSAGIHGVLTYWILKLLETPSTCRPSFARVRQYVETKINTMVPTKKQSPVLHGDGDRVFLGLDLVVERPVGRVIKFTRDKESVEYEYIQEVILDIGWAQGVSKGAIYDIYPEGKAVGPDATPLLAEVIDVSEALPFQSIAMIIDCDLDGDGCLIDLVKKGSGVVLRDWALPSRTYVNFVLPQGHTLEPQLESLNRLLSRMSNLLLCTNSPPTKPTFTVIIRQGRWLEVHENEICLPRVPKISLDDPIWPEKLAYIVDHLARFRSLEFLQYPIANSDLLPPEWFSFEVSCEKEPVFSSQSPGKYHVQNSTLLTFTFSLTHECPLGSVYFSAYVFMPSWGIAKLHPGPGQPSFNISKGDIEEFEVISRIPPATCEQDPHEVDDKVRVFVCTSQESWEELELPDLPTNSAFSPAKDLVYAAEAFEDEDDRSWKSPPKRSEERPKWAVLDITITSSLGRNDD